MKAIDGALGIGERLRIALLELRRRCDGAHSIDGRGFSKFDRPLADGVIAADEWDMPQQQLAEHLVRKYRRQLAAMGYDVNMILGVVDGVVMLGNDNGDNGDIVLDSASDSASSVSPMRQGGPQLVPERVMEHSTSTETSMEMSGADVTLVAPMEAEQVDEYIPPQPKPMPAEVPDDYVYCEFLTGAAGTGKTHEIRRRLAADSNYALLTATTGIAAINLGTITLNSALGYFDTDSLEENLIRGYLERRLREIAGAGNRAIVVDEVSMMDARQLDLLHEGIRRVNERIRMGTVELVEGEEDEGPVDGPSPLGLILTGDFCQLPPIKAKWAFDADCWGKFNANTVRLTRNWRQSDQRFLEAINLIRAGNGRDGARLLHDIGVEFVPTSSTDFDGTTIIAMNDQVNGFNFAAHMKVPGKPITVANSRWGKLRSEWRWELVKGKQAGNIPPTLDIKVGAYVMILANDSPDFTYVNGDCGHVMDVTGEGPDKVFWIELLRNKQTVMIGKLTRLNQQKDPPPGIDNKVSTRRGYYYDPDRDPPPTSIKWNVKAGRWVVGGITYYPLRLAYATTVHKSQGLTLAKVQLDLYNRFMSQPGMAYVAISRAATPEGLRLVGTPELLAERVKVDQNVMRWL